jgi:adenylate cyclase
MTATGFRCESCGAGLPPDSRFCNKCGTPITPAATSAEYKQVTVLFADVVHSMDIAAAVGAERLREIMAEFANRCAAVVKRYGGTVDKFTGDGIMAIFGAPVAMEDHAVRACLSALDIQEETARLAAEVRDRDGIDLRLRIGLNSGQVIAGEIGSGALGYTAIGEQVGMAQRMESVAPPGGVMLSESTARLVENAVVLGEPEMVHIKGVDAPVSARRLLSIGEHRAPRRSESPLVGRTWELNTVTAILDEAIGGAGCVVTIVGPPGIGKSRLIREAASVASDGGVPVFVTYCESHASDIPFHVVARLLRATMGIERLDGEAARACAREQFFDADPEDLLLLDDLLGIADPAVALPEIAPDARRRRLTALIIGASLARAQPAVYVIDDAHWIDEVSESMLADFLAVIPQIPALTLITYRPEYHGALARIAGGQSITLRPLSGAHASELINGLLGSHPSVDGLAERIASRAAGNPFFVEEIVRDLAERGVLQGERGAYELRGEVADVDVPATLQATIGARIDRLGLTAKRTLNAGAVIGLRFNADLLTALVDAPHVAPLIEAELIDQVRFSACPEYVFRHPLIRAVAYESQLKADRAELHRHLAIAIEQRDPKSADENAALIAEHLEAAGDLHAAFDWHMRAGSWFNFRDIAAAVTSWRRAQHVADELPDDDADRMAMRIAPRALVCGNTYRLATATADMGFEELRDLCTAAGDQQSLAIGMAAVVTAQLAALNRREASRLADELVGLLESIGDPTLTVALSVAAMAVKHETGEMADLLRLAQRVVDLAEGDRTTGDLVFGSPLALAIAWRGIARCCFGIAGWKDDLCNAAAMARESDPMTRGSVMWYTYEFLFAHGLALPDANAIRETAETTVIAEQSGENLAVYSARLARAITLCTQDDTERAERLELLAWLHATALNQRFFLQASAIVDLHIAKEKMRSGDLNEAIELSRMVLHGFYGSGRCIWNAFATSVLVEALLQRRTDADLEEAQAAINSLAAMPTDRGFMLHEIWLLRLRALLADAQGDEAAYPDYRDGYRDMARTLGFEGHIAWADAMP